MLLKAFHKSPSKRPYYFNRLLFSSVKKSFVYFESNKTKTMYVRTMNKTGVDICRDTGLRHWIIN